MEEKIKVGKYRVAHTHTLSLECGKCINQPVDSFRMVVFSTYIRACVDIHSIVYGVSYFLSSSIMAYAYNLLIAITLAYFLFDLAMPKKHSKLIFQMMTSRPFPSRTSDSAALMTKIIQSILQYHTSRVPRAELRTTLDHYSYYQRSTQVCFPNMHINHYH